jgi:hypothetical protein
MARSPRETYEAILANNRNRQREDEPSNFERLLGIGLKAGERIFNQVLEDRFNSFQQSEPVLASKQVARAANSNRAYWLKDLQKQEESGLGDLAYMTGLIREDVKNRLLNERPEAAKASFGFDELVERNAREEAKKYIEIRRRAIELAQKSPEDFEANIDLISRQLRPNSTQNLFDASIRGLFDGMSKEEAEQAQLASLAEYTKTDILPTEVPPGLTPTELQARRARRLNTITEEYRKTRDLEYSTMYADNEQAIQDLQELPVSTATDQIMKVDRGADRGPSYFILQTTQGPDGSTRVSRGPDGQPVVEELGALSDSVFERTKQKVIDKIVLMAGADYTTAAYNQFKEDMATQEINLANIKTEEEFNKVIASFMALGKDASNYQTDSALREKLLPYVLQGYMEEYMKRSLMGAEGEGAMTPFEMGVDMINFARGFSGQLPYGAQLGDEEEG